MVSFADMDTNSPHSSRPSSSAPVPGLQNCHSGSRDISLQEAGTNPPQSQSPIEDFDITVANLPEKLGFSSEFQDDLKSVGEMFTFWPNAFLIHSIWKTRVVLGLGGFVVQLNSWSFIQKL